MPHIIETEETLIIETPERVPLAFALASIGNRFLAVLIDHFIQYLAILIVIWSMNSLMNRDNLPPGVLFEDMSRWTVALLIFALFMLFAGYFVIFEWLWNGQTPGKRIMKLRVIREDGRPITLWEAVSRNLLRIIDAAPGFILPVYSIGLVSVFLSSRDQRIGDVFTGTVVIRERTDEAPTFAETFGREKTDGAFSRIQVRTEFVGDVRLLSEQEMEVVETFLRRRTDLGERQRIWMAWRVALPLMYKIKPAYDIKTFTYEGFLEELIHRYHANRRFLN